MKENLFNINSDPLFICDMRPGFSEDGAELSLPRGKYALTTIEIGDLQGFELLLDGKHADREEEFSELSLDGACVGVFDKNGFFKHFKHDFESIYEWSSDLFEPKQNWKNISHEKAGLAFFVQTFADCNCVLIKLYSNSTVVGFKALPIEPQTNREKKRSWTWISFKCEGLDQEFNICHDRDYVNEIDDVIDDVLSDLCTVETDSGLDFLDEDDIKLDDPINSYRSDFGGLQSISVYYERSSGGENIRHSIKPDISNHVSCVNSTSSTRELANCMYNIFKMSEKMS